jgi:hypothetical protein
MAEITINLEPKTQRTARGHRVYMRSLWSQDWTRVPFLFADEVAWRLAPELSTARLIWNYGYGMRQGEAGLSVISRLAEVRRQFVKIEIDTHDSDGGTLKWYGSIELDGRGRTWLVEVSQGNYVEGGEQPLMAVGLEHALYRAPIRGATWLDSGGTARRAERPFVFNRPGPAGEPRGNRSTGRGGLDARVSFLFSSSTDPEDATWNTKQIAEYLLAQELPKGPGGVLQWQANLDPDTEAVLPTWDKPVIDPAPNLSVGNCLNLLMPRERMLSWRLTVTTSEAGFDAVYLTPVSLLGSDVATDLGTLKKNDRQLLLQVSQSASQAPDTVWALKESDIPAIDQARVRGARRTSTCTLSRVDETIDEGWPLALETEYNQGFSTAATYAALGVDSKQAANAEVRTTDRLFAVYRRFAIPRTWNQKVKDGLGAGSEKPVFLASDSGGTGVKLVNPRELELAPTLPLKDGYDYTTIGSVTLRVPATKVSDGPHSRLPALVLFKTPEWLGGGSVPYVQVDAIGGAAAVEQVNTHQERWFSCRVEVPEQDRAVLLHVEGRPQHVIAWSNFERLPVDYHQGKWDWRDALFTVCIYDDRFAEGVWPSDDAAKTNTVAMRRDLVVHAGDQYRQDYLVPGTVIGINRTNRQPARCANGGWINDDRKVLEARAKQIFAYYGQTRNALTLATPVINAQIQLGDYVSTIGTAAHALDVGTVVSEIVVNIPGGQRPGPPVAQYATAFAQLDAYELLNKRPEPRPLGERARALGAG